MNYNYDDRIAYWKKGMTIAFDIDGTLISLIDRQPRPMVDFLIHQQATRYHHKIILWSAAGALYCKQTAKEIGIDKWVTAYYEKPPYDAPHRLDLVGMAAPPDLCYDDDPSDVLVNYGGLAVKPYTGGPDDEWVAMNHYLGGMCRRLNPWRMIMTTKNGRLDKASLTWVPECITILS